MKNRLTELMERTLTRQIMKSAEGRALLLATLADTEDNGEAPFFDEALQVLEEPRFRKMIRRHQADEIEHGRLFRARAAAQGVPVPEVPADVKVLDLIDTRLDGAVSAPVTCLEDVLEGYLLLQAVEERAIQQFALHREVFRHLDPVTADLFDTVRSDEIRHLKYCEAITRHLEPDDARRTARLNEYRRIEAEAFAEMQDNMSAYLAPTVQNPFIRWGLRVAARPRAA